MVLALKIVGAVVLLVAVILGIVFGTLGRVWSKRAARERQELEKEGIVLDSGVRGVTLHYSDYKAPGLYVGLGVTKGSRHLILTRGSLAILGNHSQHIPLAELHRYVVESVPDALIIRSSKPVGATGQIEIRMPMTDSEVWAKALHEAGASKV